MSSAPTGTECSQADGQLAKRDTTPDTRKPKSANVGRYPFSTYHKIGLLSICVLSIGMVALLGSLGVLWFIWLADDRNKAWRYIVDRNWVPRAVTLCSLVIRQAMSLQASLATAMLAAVALERAIVPLLSLASVSTTRNANGGPYMLTWWLLKGFCINQRRWATVHWPLLIVALSAVTALSQLTSFALLSDVGLTVVRAPSRSTTQPTYFQYNSDGNIPVITHGTTWTQHLQSYTSFAEYHEPPSTNLPDGVVDTGLTLRAFLPVADAQSRSMIASWDGLATVLDARTVCVRPNLIEPRVHFADEYLAVTANWSTTLTNPGEFGFQSHESVVGGCDRDVCYSQFICMAPLAPVTDNVEGGANWTETGKSGWRLTICQPYSVGADSFQFLQSQFQPPGNETRDNFRGDPNWDFGNAYVMINVSSGSETAWAEAILEEDPNLGEIKGPGTAPLGYDVHGQNSEWYDLIYSSDATLNLSISVCYTAFDTADLHVEITASGNHSDLNPSWNSSTQSYNFSQVINQYGQGPEGVEAYSASFAQRQIMQLSKRQSWLPDTALGDPIVPANRITQTSWITDYANMAGSLQSNTYNYAAGGNYATFMWQAFQEYGLWTPEVEYIFADPSLMALTQQILQSGGSLAFAMQSIVTSLTQLAYYQQVQQLNGESDVTSSSYVVASAPLRMRGILAVTIVIGVHVLIVFGIVLPAFMLLTTLSVLGNAWHAVAQVIHPTVQPILGAAVLATDKIAEEEVKRPRGKKKKLKNHDMVGLHSSDGSTLELVQYPAWEDEESPSKDASGEEDKPAPSQQLIKVPTRVNSASLGQRSERDGGDGEIDTAARDDNTSEGESDAGPIEEGMPLMDRRSERSSSPERHVEYESRRDD